MAHGLSGGYHADSGLVYGRLRNEAGQIPRLHSQRDGTWQGSQQ